MAFGSSSVVPNCLWSHSTRSFTGTGLLVARAKSGPTHKPRLMQLEAPNTFSEANLHEPVTFPLQSTPYLGSLRSLTSRFRHLHVMKSTEFLNTHPSYRPERRLHNRTFVCEACGFMRRSAGVPPAPAHCERAMRWLTHQQAVAASRLSATERVDWLRSGGHVRAVGGKRKWRASDHAA